MPLDRLRNAELRDRGWSVFRNSTRDHQIPLTGSGAQLQRWVMTQVLPVRGPDEPRVAASLEQRQVVAEARRVVESKSRDRVAMEIPAESLSLEFQVTNPTANPGPAGNLVQDLLLVGFAPFTGYISEVWVRVTPGAGFSNFIAIRTGSGGTVFRGGETFSPVSRNVAPEPDFMLVFDAADPRTFRGLHVAVLAGEQIFVVVRTDQLVGPNTVDVHGSIVMRSTEGVDVSARVAVASSSAVRAGERAALRESLAQSERLALEREKTKRAQVEAEGRVRVAAIQASERAARPSAPLANPFQQLLTNTQYIERAVTVKPPPPPPRLPAPPKEELAGEGKMYVPFWMPTVNGIGTLVPLPPRGGKVNQYNGTYYVLDLTGKVIDQGPAQLVRTTADIPPGAKISG